MTKWFDVPETDQSNVIYSRIRLVRNWKEYPFPGKMTREQGSELLSRFYEGLKGLPSMDGAGYRFAWLDRMREVEKTALLERRILNRNAVKSKLPAGLLLSEDEKTAIVFGVDDHIRIQTMEKGLCLDRLYRGADRLDDFIEDRFEYAFDGKYGYLTAFPTNAGTGLRASVIIHLPRLSGQRNFHTLAADMGRFGTSIRGVYGEGGENFGALYQISNQKTLGQSEKEIVELVTRTSAEMDAQERRLRQEALRQRPAAAADEVYKSYGVLKYARRLTRKDAMQFLSQLMAGITDGILRPKEPCSVYGLMLGIQPANLLRMAKKPLDKEELNAARADYIRARLPEIE